MDIQVNDRPLQVAAATTLWEVLIQRHPSLSTGLAVALNEQVIPKTQWKTTKLAANDRLLIIKATQGG